MPCCGNGLCSIIFQYRGSVLPFGFGVALPCALLTMFIKVMEIDKMYYFNQFGKDIVLQPAAYTGFSGLLGFLVVFRTSQAYNRYWTGATLVRQMGGSWFDSASSLVAFCRMSKNPEVEISVFQRNIIRLFSLIHALALAQLGADRDEAGSVIQRLTRLEIIDGSSINKGTFEKLAEEECSIELVFNWIQALSIDNISTGVLVVPPPILTRAFAELSDGMVKFHEGMKICLHPFPFPYSQTTLVLLILHWMIMPLVATQWTQDPLLAGFFSFLMVFIFWSLFGIASELENPFGDDANDIDADEMQAAMNQRLHMILSGDAANVPGMPSKLKERESSGLSPGDPNKDSQEASSRTSSKNNTVTDPRQNGRRPSIGCSSLWDNNDESMDACFSDKGMVSKTASDTGGRRTPRKPNDVRGRGAGDVESAGPTRQIREEGTHTRNPPQRGFSYHSVTSCDRLPEGSPADCGWNRTPHQRDIRYDAQEHVVRAGGGDSRSLFMPDEWQEHCEEGMVDIAEGPTAAGHPGHTKFPTTCSSKVRRIAPLTEPLAMGPGRRDGVRGASQPAGGGGGGPGSSTTAGGLGHMSPVAGAHLVHPSLRGETGEEEGGFDMRLSICSNSEDQRCRSPTQGQTDIDCDYAVGSAHPRSSTSGRASRSAQQPLLQTAST